MAQNPPPVQVVITATDQTRAAISSATQGLNSIKTSAVGLQGVIAGATAALAGLAVVQNFRSFVAGAAALDDMAEKTGASVEKLSALSAVARISGVSIDVVENSLIRLAKGLAGADEESKGAGNALAALGLKAEDLKKLDTADALKIVADRLNEYKDGAGKTALAIDLLGKAGAQALPYLKDLAETQNLVGKVTAEQAAQAENLQKNLVRLAASTSGAWKEFSAAVLPTVDAFVKALLDAQNRSGGLRDEVKRLTADGSIRDWAESAAIGIAYLVDAIRNVINGINLAGATTATLVIGLELVLAKARASAERGRSSQFSSFEREVNNLRNLKNEAEAGVSDAFKKFVEAPQFSTLVREKFAALRNAAASIDTPRKSLAYTSNVAKTAGAAKDELASIETYVAGIRENLVGATEGEFEKMRQKARDVFGKVDVSKLSSGDAERFARLFRQVSADIDALDERARNANWAKALADSFKLAGDASDAAGASLANFNAAVSQQGQDLQFELDTVNKLSSERQKLAAIRKIDLDAQRAAAAVPDSAGNRDEVLQNIAATADLAKARVAELYDQIRSSGRDGFTALTNASRDYFDRISNDAENVRMVFTTAFKGMEDALVNFVVKGKLDFRSLAESILSDLVRIQVRQNITGPLSQAISSGTDGIGDFFKGLFRAGGGPVAGGLPYIVGERGPEWFVPDAAGTVLPNGNAPGGGGISIVMAPTFNVDARSDRAQVIADINNGLEYVKNDIFRQLGRGGAWSKRVGVA